MNKFIKFRERKYHNKTGWMLYDIAVNVDNISMVKKIDTTHTFENYDVERNLTAYKEIPVTMLVLYDGTNISVLGSYDEILLKIEGEYNES